MVLSISQEVLESILKYLVKHKYQFLRMFAHMLLVEATQELNLTKKELVIAISWSKGKEAIAIYDLAGPSGNSQKIFLQLKQLLKGIHEKLLQCDCSSSCNNCFGDLTRFFKFNPKPFLIRLLELITE